MISTKGRYAIRVMIDIAENSNGGYVPLKDIAARQDISKKYLEAIGKELVSGGLLMPPADAAAAINCPGRQRIIRYQRFLNLWRVRSHRSPVSKKMQPHAQGHRTARHFRCGRNTMSRRDRFLIREHSLTLLYSDFSQLIFQGKYRNLKGFRRCLRSPFYGAGVQIAFSISQCFQWVQSLILRFLQKSVPNPPIA